MANLSLKPSSLAVGGRPIHYAWVIVAVGAVMRLFSSSFRSSSSILIPRLVDSFALLDTEQDMIQAFHTEEAERRARSRS